MVRTNVLRDSGSGETVREDLEDVRNDLKVRFFLN